MTKAEFEQMADRICADAVNAKPVPKETMLALALLWDEPPDLPALDFGDNDGTKPEVV